MTNVLPNLSYMTANFSGPSAGDLRELPRVPLRGEESCGGDWPPLHAHGDLTNLALHERLPEILIVPREETHTAAARPV